MLCEDARAHGGQVRTGERVRRRGGKLNNIIYHTCVLGSQILYERGAGGGGQNIRV